MFDDLIFTLEDVRLVRKVSVNIDDFDMYAQEVQRNYLEKILGAKLYAAMLAGLAVEPVAGKWTDLVNGKSYEDGKTVLFRGLKIYCSYLWLYVYTLDSDMAITPTGSKLFKDEYSEPAKTKQAIDHYIAAASGMEDGILNYLRANASTYTEFSESSQITQAKNDNATFRVIGKRYTTPRKLF